MKVGKSSSNWNNQLSWKTHTSSGENPCQLERNQQWGFFGCPAKLSNDNDEEDSSFEENLGNDKFVHNMSRCLMR